HGARGDARSRAVRGSRVLRPARAGARADVVGDGIVLADARHGAERAGDRLAGRGARRVRRAAPAAPRAVDPAELPRRDALRRAHVPALVAPDGGAAAARLP